MNPKHPFLFSCRHWTIALLVLTATVVHAQDPRDHWAFQPLASVPVPTTTDAAVTQTPVDAFILARLESEQLSLSPAATRATWIRRVTYNLTGLPPTPAQVRQFISHDSPIARQQVIERLLASPTYGERWGKYWLDVAGYADSNGYFHADTNRPYAYHYRDYVIRSFNSDTPYDVFIRQQLAGDELLGERDNPAFEEVHNLMVATHFLRNAPDGSSESDGNPEEVTIDRVTALEGSLQITMNSLLGLTIQCARCHAHKFEPIHHDEYYRLQAILYPAFPAFHNDKWVVPVKRIGPIARAKEFQQWKQQMAKIDTEVAALEAAKKKDGSKAEELDKQIKAVNSQRPSQPGTVAWVTDVVAPAPDTFRLESGDYQSPAERVTAAGLAILSEGESTLKIQPIALPSFSSFAGHGEDQSVTAEKDSRPSTGRRLAFARWITKPNSRATGLLARVIANRIWQHHFGTGLVTTVDNFGLSGSPPSNPELLEYLARYLVDHDWSIKSLHRLILTSAVYQQGSVSTADHKLAFNVDPANQLLWKYPLQRLDAEAIRDSLLAVSGELDTRMFGPYTPTERTGNGDVIASAGHPQANRRAIYLQQRRTQVNTLLELFDAPSIVSNCPQRGNSTVPLQSLAFLNSDFVLARATAFASRLDRFDTTAIAQRIPYSFYLLVGRNPTYQEMKASLDFLDKQRQLYRNKEDADKRLWTDYCQMLLATSAFLYLE